MTADSKLIHVRMLGVPLDRWQRARVWFEGLLREFDILVIDTDHATPRELLEFVNETRDRFSRFTEGSNAALEEAYQLGLSSTDIELALPPEAAPVARRLWDQIQEADEYCRRGDLLTLTLDDDLRGYVSWYLHEVVNQLEGSEPRAWDPQPPTR